MRVGAAIADRMSSEHVFADQDALGGVAPEAASAAAWCRWQLYAVAAGRLQNDMSDSSFAPGDFVRIIAAEQREEYNGKDGRLLNRLEDRDRWLVRMDDGACIMCRQYNFQAVGSAGDVFWHRKSTRSFCRHSTKSSVGSTVSSSEMPTLIPAQPDDPPEGPSQTGSSQNWAQEAQLLSTLAEQFGFETEQVVASFSYNSPQRQAVAGGASVTLHDGEGEEPAVDCAGEEPAVDYASRLVAGSRSLSRQAPDVCLETGEERWREVGLEILSASSSGSENGENGPPEVVRATWPRAETCPKRLGPSRGDAQGWPWCNACNGPGSPRTTPREPDLIESALLRGESLLFRL